MDGDVDMDLGDYDGRTALHLACSENQFDVVEFLLKNGVKNVNPLDRWGNTPLDDAIRGGFDDCVELLKKYKAKSG
jgi:glutaminase